MKRSFVRSFVSGALLATALMTAGDPADAQGSKRDASESGAPNEYRIGPEDMLHISVWKNDTISRTVPVRPDGKISLPLLNDVQAAGLTPTELQAVLVKRLSDYMPAPEVAVIVTEVRSFKVSVLGEVARPGRFELKSWTTVSDVLAMAGGFTPFASRSRIVVLRPEGNTIRRIPFDYKKLVDSSGADSDTVYYLHPGDTVLVP
jgi:polysaccharide export outer membrane protein